jgi:hypothetical protein
MGSYVTNKQKIMSLKEAASGLEVFDIDGTLTYTTEEIKTIVPYSSFDLFHCITSRISNQSLLFDQEFSFWKKKIADGGDPYLETLDMMNIALTIMPEDTTGNSIYNCALGIVDNFIDFGIIREGSIQYLNKKLQSGIKCILSTANYHEGALAFKDRLVERGLIERKNIDHLIVIGSEIDWKLKSISHLNYGEKKVDGICKYFNSNLEELKQYVNHSYGDDPDRNDKHILELASKKSFVIETPSNSAANLSLGMVRTSWEKLLRSII